MIIIPKLIPIRQAIFAVAVVTQSCEQLFVGVIAFHIKGIKNGGECVSERGREKGREGEGERGAEGGGQLSTKEMVH